MGIITCLQRLYVGMSFEKVVFPWAAKIALWQQVQVKEYAQFVPLGADCVLPPREGVRGVS